MAKKSINLRVGYDMKAFSTSSQTLVRNLQKTGRQMKSIGKSMSMSLTAPIAALGGLSVKTFATFEQSMAKVKAISGATGAEFEALGKLAKDLGISTRFAASEVSDLMLNYSKLGFSSAEIQKITGATLDLALATGEDLASSATVAGGTLRAFGLDATQMGMVTDVMAKSFSSSALDLQKFEVSMSTIAPIANGLGQSLQETTAQLAVLVNNGIDASTAGTMLRNMMLKATKDGFSMDEALTEIANSTDKAGTSLKFFDARATATALVLADNIDNVKGLNTEFMNAEGSAADMAKIMDATLQGALFSLKSKVEGLGIAFGEVLAPTISKVSDFVGTMAFNFAKLEPETKKIIVVTAALVAGIGPLIFAIGALNTSLAFLAANPVVAILGVLAVSFVALQLVASETNKIFDDVAVAVDQSRAAYKKLGEQIDTINTLKGQGVKASKDEIKLAIMSAKASLKTTNALILENIERRKKLLADKESALELAKEATKGMDKGGVFNFAMGNVKALEANINKISEEIKNLQSQGGAAVDGLIDLENQLKNIGKTQVAQPTSSTASGSEVKETKTQSRLADIVFQGQQRIRDIKHQINLAMQKDQEKIDRMSLEHSQTSEINELNFKIAQLEKKKNLNADEVAELANLQNEKKQLTQLHLAELSNLEDSQAESRVAKAKTEAEKELQILNNIQRKKNLDTITNEESFQAAEFARQKKHLEDLIELRKKYGQDVSDLQVKLSELLRTQNISAAKKLGEDMGKALSEGLQRLATQGLTQFGEFLGSVLAGGDVTPDDFGRGILETIGQFMQQFGSAMIALGVANLKLGAAIAAGPAGAPLAIGAGIALVAAGSALSQMSKKGIGNTDDNIGPDPVGNGNFGSQGGMVNEYMLETKISGRDLVLVQKREMSFTR